MAYVVYDTTFKTNFKVFNTILSALLLMWFY